MGPLLYPVYPRWRGELDLQDDITEQVNGLSPLARGTRLVSGSLSCCGRFIPAGAGNSRPHKNTLARQAVYPRWRGELSRGVRRRTSIAGLSPLARGTHYGPGKKRAGGRFIPAGAGNSHRQHKYNVCAAVYPRWRGELTSAENPSRDKAGLSPLARGTLSFSI